MVCNRPYIVQNIFTIKNKRGEGPLYTKKHSSTKPYKKESTIYKYKGLIVGSLR